MYIDKAIKKQKKSFYIFIFFMVFIALTLPLIAIFFMNYFTITAMIILSLIESIIIICIIFLINEMTLKYDYYRGRLRVKTSLFQGEKAIFCDKVVLVHATRNIDDLFLVIIYLGNSKNNLFKDIDKDIFEKYQSISDDYKKVKKLYPDCEFSYAIIKHGGLKKFKLLDDIYKKCVKAVYTDEAIENIKIARSVKKIKFHKG